MSVVRLKTATSVAGVTLAALPIIAGAEADSRIGAVKADRNGAIAFSAYTSAAGPRRIFLINPSGSGRTQLQLPRPDTPVDPELSPDGRRLAFVDLGLSPYYVGVVKADGSQFRRLTTGRLPGDVAWSPDSTRIAYQDWLPRSQDESQTDLFVINSNGAGKTNVTNTPTRDEGTPTWSPDGKRIAYSAYDPDGSGIYVMIADGSNVTLLRRESVYGLSWSPDGSAFAFPSTAGGIFVMTSDGRDLRRLTSHLDHEPNWSPDGRRIAFMREDPDRGDDVYVMNADGSGQVNITKKPALMHQDVDWGKRPPPSLLCRVPRTVGLRLAMARARIVRAKCLVGPVRYIASTRRPGRILRQSPPGGTRLFANGRVSLVISR